ncbi:hypothetical protein EXN66_Car012843 [Channa argus]|uniref:Uncharacterized protein n=1 Tax=Channa argus TaxID=215402 RepID=A0A6G1Q475_CHAAH|nr:hypothetical protein EXN66_Car012843 [Channa argus]
MPTAASADDDDVSREWMIILTLHPPKSLTSRLHTDIPAERIVNSKVGCMDASSTGERFDIELFYAAATETTCAFAVNSERKVCPSQHFLHDMISHSGQVQVLLVRLSNEQADTQSRLNKQNSDYANNQAYISPYKNPVVTWISACILYRLAQCQKKRIQTRAGRLLAGTKAWVDTVSQTASRHKKVCSLQLTGPSFGVFSKQVSSSFNVFNKNKETKLNGMMYPNLVLDIAIMLEMKQCFRQAEWSHNFPVKLPFSSLDRSYLMFATECLSVDGGPLLSTRAPNTPTVQPFPEHCSEEKRAR